MKQTTLSLDVSYSYWPRAVDDLLHAKTSTWPSTGRQASIAGSPLLGARCGPVAKLWVGD
jgi:hypothetical protein